MQYRAIKKHPYITIGKIYEEYFAYPCVFNACIRNDNDDVVILPRDEFFKEILTMKVKLLSQNAISPKRCSDHAAGYDLYAAHNTGVTAGECTIVSTRIAVAIPTGYVSLIKPRSGLAFKEGIDTMAGVIDSDYRGEVKVLLTCHEDGGGMDIEHGDRIAQLVVVPCLQESIEIVDDLDETERGSDGFGSTGVK